MGERPDWTRWWWNAWIRSPRSHNSHENSQQVRTVILIVGAESDPDLTSVFVMGGLWRLNGDNTRTRVIDQHGPVTYQAACQLRDDIAAQLRSDGNDVHLEISVHG